ncbi:MAG: AAA family ATPase, partial [Nitrospiria bacterium]
FTASLRKLEPATYVKRRQELFDFISFDRSIHEFVRDLPGGTKQQVMLAAALLHDPEIIFLDEPTAGVSPASRNRFWLLIRKLSERGITVFVTTHHMDEAEQCDRIVLMQEGKIIAMGSPEMLKQETFPTPVLEFDPKGPVSFLEISAMKHHPIFLFFEPYGLKFHASIKSEAMWQEDKSEFEEKFTIRQIKPSLEDVFIQRAERKVT